MSSLAIPKVDFITSSNGKPKSVVLRFKDWKQIVETLGIISSKELIQSIRSAKQKLKNGHKLLTKKEVFKNL